MIHIGHLVPRQLRFLTEYFEQEPLDAAPLIQHHLRISLQILQLFVFSPAAISILLNFLLQILFFLIVCLGHTFQLYIQSLRLVSVKGLQLVDLLLKIYYF